MKKIFIPLLLIVFPVIAYALNVHEFKAHINDYAAVVAPATFQKPENCPSEFEKTGSTRIVVSIIPGLRGENNEEYAITTARTWKTGQKGKDK